MVENEEQLARRVQFIHESLGTAAIVEQFIDGRELYVGVIGNQRLRVFPVWEMSFAQMPERTLAHRDRAGEVEHVVPEEARHHDRAAALPENEVAQIQHLAKRAYRALDLTGYARIDFRMDDDGKLYVIEANPNPQLARGEDFAESAERAGVMYPALLERIVSLGLAWHPERVR